jgi:hypothetical protein
MARDQNDNIFFFHFFISFLSFFFNFFIHHINPEISQLKNRDKDEDLEIEAIKLLEVG